MCDFDDGLRQVLSFGWVLHFFVVSKFLVKIFLHYVEVTKKEMALQTKNLRIEMVGEEYIRYFEMLYLIQSKR